MEKWSRDLHRIHMDLILVMFSNVREEDATRTTREGLDMLSCVMEHPATRIISVGLDMCRGAGVLAVTRTISTIFLPAAEAKEYQL